jgi:hypothetical protein
MNRSNAIALGVLVQYFKMDFFKALELIQSRVPIISPNIVALTKLLMSNFHDYYSIAILYALVYFCLEL